MNPGQPADALILAVRTGLPGPGPFGLAVSGRGRQHGAEMPEIPGRRITFHGDFLQLAAGKEPDPLAVWREEGILGAFGTGQRHSLQLVEPPQVEAGLLVAAAGPDRQPRAVG